MSVITKNRKRPTYFLVQYSCETTQTIQNGACAVRIMTGAFKTGAVLRTIKRRFGKAGEMSLRAKQRVTKSFYAAWVAA